MKIKSFTELNIWIKSKTIVLFIYNNFKYNRDFGFKDQIQRSSISIMNNIAEGFDRKNDKEFIRFLKISEASCSETLSMVCLCKDLNYLSENDIKYIEKELIDISKMINKLISCIKNRLSN
jgi:four helix bundle protein